MKRITMLLLLCLFCLSPVLAAQAESVTLSSDDGGYSITLPDGWAKMDPAMLKQAGALEGSPLSAKAKAQLLATLQGASFASPDASRMDSLVIHHAANAAMGISPADVKTITAPGNPLAEKIRKDTESTLHKAGMRLSPAMKPPDGLATGMEQTLPDKRVLYGIMQVRFTTDNVILLSAVLIAPDALSRKEEVQDVLDRLIIGPEKSLLQPAGDFTDAVRPAE